MSLKFKKKKTQTQNPHHFIIYLQPDWNELYVKTKEEIALRNSTPLSSWETQAVDGICLLSLYSGNL